MIVSWNWLKDYVSLDMDLAELEHRLAMAGLNHESTEKVAGDLAIDLEVTSNRPDCLGHLGVAREVSVLWKTPLKIPVPTFDEKGPPVESLAKISITAPDLCYRYTARVIRGVKIGPSPDWLTDRLRTLGIAVINNVVDVSNYVMMECGQPLHAFDLALLKGPEIVVREAEPEEQFEAIDHRMYPLAPGMCVIADAERSVALGGVMGSVNSEVSDQTVDVLVESAEFAPLSIRTTARRLALHSPSSYRFERGVDPEGVDWASRRCCQLILETGGGELAKGVLDIGRPCPTREMITLRRSQLPRILGIEIEMDEVKSILTDLGNEPMNCSEESITVIPPTWRRDLTRESDLVEEVARIHGYDEISENVGVPMVPSHRTYSDRILEKVRHVLTAAGFDEAMTASVVPKKWVKAFTPWSEAKPLRTLTPMLKGADRLRMSLVPSLLEARRVNESVANPTINLFETARIYLPSDRQLPCEQPSLAIAADSDFAVVKGLLEGLVDALDITEPLLVVDSKVPMLDALRQCQLKLGDQLVGYLGEVTAAGLKQFGLRRPTTVAELNVAVLEELADLIPQHRNLSDYPAIQRDVNLIVDEAVRWADLQDTIAGSAGELLESLQFQEVYRDPKKDGVNRKRLLFSVCLRSSERTLTNEEADQIRQTVVDRCAEKHGAELLG
jgi:phenylalanyl-tRNA synthetase beta chain